MRRVDPDTGAAPLAPTPAADAVPALRWEQVSATTWHGCSGSKPVASVWGARAPETWLWATSHVGSGHPACGEASTPQAARSAAEAGWQAWLRDAGLVPVADAAAIPAAEFLRVQAERDRLARRIRGAKAVLDGAAVAAAPGPDAAADGAPCGWATR